jgi:pyridoxal phosphate enzyme (YggS family)
VLHVSRASVSQTTRSHGAREFGGGLRTERFMSSDNSQVIADNVRRVRSRIRDAASACGRSEAEITMVAVTKYVGVAEVQALIQSGCRYLGESRPQQLWSKAAAMETHRDASGAVHWHLVGHLQRNKAARTIPLVSLIHSVDSVRLLECIENESKGRSQPTAVLLQVNISGEEAKHGFAPDQVEPVLETMPRYPHVRLLGLMAMAGLEGGRERAHHDFASLRQLRDRLRPNCPANMSLDELSMGMSADYDLAIAEGATIVRIGSTLFEGLDL